MEEIIKAKTDKQYDEMWRYIMEYTKGNLKRENGQIHFYSNTQTIIPKTKTKEVIISGENKENIHEIKKYLEYIVQTKNRNY